MATPQKPMELDYRGMKCPEPILQLARTARANEGKRVLVLSDDAAFPMDVRAWCRTTKAEIIKLESNAGVHQVELQLPGKGAAKPAAKPAPAPAPVARDAAPTPAKGVITVSTPEAATGAGEEVKVDCRGERCPAPVMMVARAARNAAPGTVLDVLADDEAFPMDVKAWCRASGNELVEMDTASRDKRARIRISGGDAKASVAPAPVVAAPAPAPIPAPAPAPAGTEQVIDCRGERCPAPIVKVAKAAKGMKPGLLFVVLSDDAAFPKDIEAWCRSTGNAMQALDQSDQGVWGARIIKAGPGVDARAMAASASAAQAAAPAAAPAAAAPTAAPAPQVVGGVVEVDCTADQPPTPILKLSGAAMANPGKALRVSARYANFQQDLMNWCSSTHAQMMSFSCNGGVCTAEIQPAPSAVAMAPAVAPAAAPAAAPAPAVGASAPGLSSEALVAAAKESLALTLPVAPDAPVRENKCTLLVLHNDFDALLAAFLVANGALAQGMDVAIFFSFWGVNVLRGDRARPDAAKPTTNIIQKMMKMMMPKGAHRQKLGQMHMLGMGKGLLTWLMGKKNVMPINAMIEALVEGEARFIVCTMSMEIMGIEERDLVELPNMVMGGVAAYVEEARTSSLAMVF